MCPVLPLAVWKQNVASVINISFKNSGWNAATRSLEMLYPIEIISGLGYEHPFTPWPGTRSRERVGEYLRKKNQIGMRLLRSAERHIPDLGSHLDYVEFATSLSNEYWVNSFNGEISALNRPGPIRPRMFCQLYGGHRMTFCGGGRRHSAGVADCMASGVWAVNQAVEFLGYSEVIAWNVHR